MLSSRLIFVIDDDEAVRDSLRMMLAKYRFDVHCYSSAIEALKAKGTMPGCIVCDVDMPDMSGLDFQVELKRRHLDIPLILITGHGDVSTAVAALKAGAHDFIEKPFQPDRLIDAIFSAVDTATLKSAEGQELRERKKRVGELSLRQRQVMDLAVQGLSNKEIASTLQISPRTVETYRAWVMERTGSRNLADLVRLAMRLDACRDRRE